MSRYCTWISRHGSWTCDLCWHSFRLWINDRVVFDIDYNTQSIINLKALLPSISKCTKSLCRHLIIFALTTKYKTAQIRSQTWSYRFIISIPVCERGPVLSKVNMADQIEKKNEERPTMAAGILQSKRVQSENYLEQLAWDKQFVWTENKIDLPDAAFQDISIIFTWQTTSVTVSYNPTKKTSFCHWCPR